MTIDLSSDKESCPVVERARADIRALHAYSSARSLIKAASDMVFLDANEMPCEPLIGVEGYGRYAPQQPAALVAALCDLYGVPAQTIMVARGADEAIDILIRIFCDAGQDNIIICPPAFPMYAQSAKLQGAAIKSVPLMEDFSPDVRAIIDAVDAQTKIVFLCSPNNPTGNGIDLADVRTLCEALADKALLVIDEAYIEFSSKPSCLALLSQYSNLAILRTLSKAYALAGVRCGVLIAHPAIVALSLIALAPYPLAVPAIETVLKTLAAPNRARLDAQRVSIIETRDWFVKELSAVKEVEKIYPSDANFALVRFSDAAAVMKLCRENGFILRDQSHHAALKNCLRISIGTREQMEDLIAVLRTGQRTEKPSGRLATVVRRTKETSITVCVNLDQADPVHIHTGVGFYDHMLDQVARHGGFALTVECAGDLHIDPHHTIEDCAIALGQALRQALGDKAGIGRYGFTLPMDEALAQAVIDLSGRSFLKFDGVFPEPSVGAMPTDMVAHVFRSLAENMQATIHLTVTGENTHHMVEGCFKAFGRALRQAVRKEGDALPSTKGVL